MSLPDRKLLLLATLTATLLLLLVPTIHAQETNAANILSLIAEKNAARQSALGSYTSTRTYRLDYTGIGGAHSAELVARLDYRAPGIKHFTVVSESGSKAICEKVLRKLVESEEEASQMATRANWDISPQNYIAQLIGEDHVDGMRTWVLNVTPKNQSKYTYQGRIWVNMDDDAIVRVEAQPAKNPSFWVGHATFDAHYENVGGFWLPQKNVTVSHIRIGGEAKLTIDFGTYAVQPLQANRGETHPVF